MKKKLIFIITLIVLIGIDIGVILYLFKEIENFYIFNLETFESYVTPTKRKNTDTDLIRQTVPLPQYHDEIPVRPEVALSGASRKTVFDLRKEAVAQSPFAQENYKPLEAVFGQIVSGKPWYALTICRNQDHAMTDGPSEETRFINNPTALVALEPGIIFFTNPSNAWCWQEDANTVIQKIVFNGPKKEIAVTYLNLPLKTKDSVYYNFNGINARDLGYPFMYVDLERSTYKISFRSPLNASTDVYEFRNFLHLGNSCSVEGGCNNGSPYQSELGFYKPTQKSKVPREIYIKLWKERPSSPQDEADIVERIIILP